MNDFYTYFITWKTYGTWLPGDARGWRKRRFGFQEPNRKLEDWCRTQMRADPILLSEEDRRTVEAACKEHCDFRDWKLLAVNARTNHVHVVVVANEDPRVVRNQLKANCTRQLRSQNSSLILKQTRAKGADIEVLDTEEDVQSCVEYVVLGQ